MSIENEKTEREGGRKGGRERKKVEGAEEKGHTKARGVGQECDEPVEPLKNNRIPRNFYEIVGRCQHPPRVHPPVQDHG